MYVCVGILFVWNFEFSVSRSQVYIGDEVEDTWWTFRATCVQLLFEVEVCGGMQDPMYALYGLYSKKDAWRREHVGMGKAAS